MGEAAARLLTVDEFLAWETDGTDRRHQLLRGVVTVDGATTGGARPLGVTPQSSLGWRPAAALRAGDRSRHQATPPRRHLLPGRSGRHLQSHRARPGVSCRPDAHRRGTVPVDRGHGPPEARRLSPDPGAHRHPVRRQHPVARIEHWHRQGDVWVVAVRGAGEQLALATFGLTLDIDALYAGLPIEGEPSPEAAIG